VTRVLLASCLLERTDHCAWASGCDSVVPASRKEITLRYLENQRTTANKWCSTYAFLKMSSIIVIRCMIGNKGDYIREIASGKVRQGPEHPVSSPRKPSGKKVKHAFRSDFGYTSEETCPPRACSTSPRLVNDHDHDDVASSSTEGHAWLKKEQKAGGRTRGIRR